MGCINTLSFAISAATIKNILMVLFRIEGEGGGGGGGSVS